MADYGVNIKVAVQNSQKVKQLGDELNRTGRFVDTSNKLLAKMAGVTVEAVANVGNLNKALAEAKKNFNDAVFGTKAFNDAARDLVRTNDLVTKSLEERAEALKAIAAAERSMGGRTMYGQPIGPAPASTIARGGPGQPQHFFAGAGSDVPSSPVAERIARSLRAAEEMEEVYASIARLGEKSVEQENERVVKLRLAQKELDEELDKARKIADIRNDPVRRRAIQEQNEEFEEQSMAKRDRRQGLLDRARAAQRLSNDLKNQQAVNQIEQRNIRANAALELMRKKDNEAALQRIRQRPIFTGGVGQALGSGLIGGAFPLLFGQGVGAAAGGTLGGLAGGAIGGQFGFALSLVGTQLGTVADQAVAFAAALDPLKPDFDVLKEKLGAVNNVTGELIDRYVALEEEENALALATEELTRLVGEDGVDALKQFGADSEELASTFAQAMTVMTVGLVKFIKDTGAILGISDELNKKVLIAQASVSDDPVLRSLVEERAQFKRTATAFASPLPPFLAPLARSLNLGDPNIVRGAQAGFARTEQQIIERQTAANARRRTELEERLSGLATPEQREAATKSAQQAARQAQQTNAFIAGLERSLALTQAVTKLDQDKVAAQNKLEKSMERVRDIQDDELRATAGYLVLQQYQADITRAETAERERQEKIQDRVNREADRERKKREAEFERNEKALLRLQQRGERQRERAEAAQIEKAGALIDKLSAERELRLAILNGTEEQVRRQQRINELMVGQKEGMRAIVENYVDFEIAETKAIEKAKELEQTYENIGASIKDGVVDAITAAVDRTRTLGEVASNVLRNIANQLLRLGVNQLFGAFGFGGGGGGSTNSFAGVPNNVLDSVIGERALGGAVGAGRPYMVGERGPELFVPGAQGNIVPNNAMGGANVTVNVDASGSSVQGDGPSAQQLGKAIGAAVQAELIKQKRPGGLLTR